MRRVLIALVLTMICAGCNEQKAPKLAAEGSIVGEGTIHRGVGPECPDTWHIATADGRMLWPIDDPAFHVDGLRVRFAARERHGAASICMTGTIVELTSIKKI